MDKIIKKISFVIFILLFFNIINFKTYATTNDFIENEEPTVATNSENTDNETVNEEEESTNTVENTNKNTITTTKKTKLTTIIVNSEELTDGEKTTVEDATVTVYAKGVDLYYITVNGSSVSGNKVSLKEGINTVVVESEAGDSVTVYITREEEDNTLEDTEENKIETTILSENEELALSSLKVKDWNISPEFNPSIYTYTIDIQEENCNSLDITATANSTQATVSIYGADNITEGENVVNILVTSENESEVKTYQIIVNKASANNLKDNQEIIKIIAIIAGIIIIIIFIIVLIRKLKKRKNEKYVNREKENKGKKSKGKH